MVVGGLAILSLVVVPIFYYQFIYGPTISQKELIKPITVQAAQDSGIGSGDYTKASTWFPTAKPQSIINNQVPTYTISTPDLKTRTMSFP